MNSSPHDDADVDYEPEDELGSAAALKAKLAKMRAELESAQKERQEYLDGWQRAKADLINERREGAESAKRGGEYATIRLLEELIPALDSFDMAILSESWKSVDPAWRIGMESVSKQIESALNAQGIAAFGSIGETYDAMRHEVSSEIDADGEPGTVARILRRGWKLQDRVIRPAHVVLIKTKS